MSRFDRTGIVKSGFIILETTVDPATRSIAIEAVQTLMEFHGAAVSKVVKILADGGAVGSTLLARMAQDDLVSSMLLLYGLHPDDFKSRVHSALDRARPAVQKLGGNIISVDVTDNIVRLRVDRDGHGCQSTVGKIKNAIEEAIFDKAPEVSAIEIEGLSPPAGASGFVPLEQLRSGHNGRINLTTGDSHVSQRPAEAHACAGH